jgi:hypothetical protein
MIRVKRAFWIILLLVIPIVSYAQNLERVKVGITGGVDYNDYSIDTNGYDAWVYEGGWGATMGVFGVYEFKDWLAFRLEVNFTQKNHRQYSTAPLDYTDITQQNWYWQVPMMFSFSYGKRLKGIVNIGGYSGYWINKKETGNLSDYISPWLSLSGKYVEREGFNNKRDHRNDFGWLLGIGAEYAINKRLATQIEGRCYYSVNSTTEKYMRVYSPTYNTTFTLQASLVYSFNAFKVEKYVNR